MIVKKKKKEEKKLPQVIVLCHVDSTNKGMAYSKLHLARQSVQGSQAPSKVHPGKYRVHKLHQRHIR